MSDCTRIDLLRHGACEGGNIFRGRCDVPLSDEGVAQMSRALAQTQSPWQVVISSPLKRCAEFARSLQQGDAQLVLDERLREMSFGDWDGRLIEDIWRDDNAAISAWAQDPSKHQPPNGESLGELAARVQACLDYLLSVYRGQRLLLVTHGGVFRVVLAQVLGMPLSHANRFDVPYACLSSVAIYHSEMGDAVKLLGHNWASGESGLG